MLVPWIILKFLKLLCYVPLMGLAPVIGERAWIEINVMISFLIVCFALCEFS